MLDLKQYRNLLEDRQNLINILGKYLIKNNDSYVEELRSIYAKIDKDIKDYEKEYSNYRDNIVVGSYYKAEQKPTELFLKYLKINKIENSRVFINEIKIDSCGDLRISGFNLNPFNNNISYSMNIDEFICKVSAGIIEEVDSSLFTELEALIENIRSIYKRETKNRGF